jgi:hypothetical protein
MNKLNNQAKQNVTVLAKSAKAQFLLTAYQGLMLAIILSILIGHGEAL